MLDSLTIARHLTEAGLHAPRPTCWRIQSAMQPHDWDRTGDALNRGRHAARRDQLIPRRHLPCDALAGQHDREGCGSPAAPLTPPCSTGRHGMLLSRDGHWSATTPSAILIW